MKKLVSTLVLTSLMIGSFVTQAQANSGESAGSVKIQKRLKWEHRFDFSNDSYWPTTNNADDRNMIRKSFSESLPQDQKLYAKVVAECRSAHNHPKLKSLLENIVKLEQKHNPMITGVRVYTEVSKYKTYAKLSYRLITDGGDETQSYTNREFEQKLESSRVLVNATSLQQKLIESSIQNLESILERLKTREQSGILDDFSDARINNRDGSKNKSSETPSISPRDNAAQSAGAV